jgi:glycine hydroxymethyltransferase
MVVNRNTIPGDATAANPSGVRLGTPWITQRGFTAPECETLGVWIGELLHACVPYVQAARKGSQPRAKVDFGVLHDLQIKVRDLALGKGIDFRASTHTYPHFYYLDDPAPRGKYAVLELRGEAAGAMLRWAVSARPEALETGASARCSMSLPGKVVRGVVTRGAQAWQLTLPAEDAVRAAAWLRGLSDGFVAFDAADVTKRIPGPVIVTLAGTAPKLPEAAGDPGSDKPWFIGMPEAKGRALPRFKWVEPPEGEPRATALNATHREMGAKMVPFAGWDMPVWYSSVIEEHLATRNAAGLFDVSHMGVYQVEGPQAEAFLDSVVTNDVAALAVGESHYTQFLDPDGAVIDDTMVYRRRADMYLVVVNASNDDKDWAWLNAVKEGRVRVDNARPWATAFGRDCRLRNLRDPKEGADQRVDIALQGPKSREILLALGCGAEAARQLKGLPWAGVMEGVFGGIDLVVSRTGYTGERVAYELFVHPGKSVELWKALLKVGAPMGLKPVGLGARDSLRTEAGLPLYGHEMAGPHGLGVGHAGFGSYCKTNKPWFIGRSAFLEQEAARDGEVVRFRFETKGVRMAHSGDPIVDTRGTVIGYVTSCAVDREGYLLGQAYLQRRAAAEGTPIGVYQGASADPLKPVKRLRPGDRTPVPTPARVLSRFPR